MYNNYKHQGYNPPATNSYGHNPYGQPSNSYPPPSGSSASHSSDANSPSSNTANLMSRMDESAAVALLQHLDKNELQHLMDNDSKLGDLIADLPQVRRIQTEHDDLIATNKSLAEYNLSLQPRLENLKQTVASDYERGNSLKTNLAQDKATLDTYVGRQSLDTLLALLQTETAKSEEEAEELANRFCDSSLDMEDFITQYLPKRTHSHLRRIKSERMAELIRSGQRSTNAPLHSTIPPPNISNPTSSIPPPYPPTGMMGGDRVPYPVGGAVGMPQPGMAFSYH